MTTGYTPLFASLTTGTLCGRWPDIGLWPVVLSLADRHGIVDVTPAYLSGVTGLPVDQVEACMHRFCEADPYSRSTDENGSRLVLIDPIARNWGWRIVNHGKYREKARKGAYGADRTASGRDAERKRAERVSGREVPDSPDASRELPLSDQSRADQSRPDAVKNTDTSPEAGGESSRREESGSAKCTSKVRPAYETREFHDQVIAAYHEILPELPRVKDWDDDRPKALNARIRERLAKGKPADTIAYWRNLFTNAATNDNWCGRRPDSDWKANLSWFLTKRNFRKVIEWEPSRRRGNGVIHGR